MAEAWIIDGVRSPRGKGKSNGSLHHIHPQELLAQVLNGLRDQSGLDTADVDDVIIGNGNPQGDQSACIGRMSVLAAGWPVEAPGVTLDRFCGSGQQAVTFAAMGIQAGHQDVVVAGGVESMSRWPVPDGPPDFTVGNSALRELYPLVPQGISADLIATREGFTRDDVDAFALTSQERAAVAIEEGRFERSLVAITNPDGSVALDHDEFPRPGTTLEGLGKLDPSFGKMGAHVFEGFDASFDDMCRQAYPEVTAVDHVHHAGNSSGVVDGASALLLTSPDYAKAHGLTPRGRVVMSAVAGAEPVIMLTAPGPASQKCLDRAGMTVDDIDLWEINEAFAAIPMKTMRDLGLDPDRVNVNGGAIALGHPIGATGGILIQTVLDELERQDKTLGLITMCTGGGMGTATIIERI
ncbi:MAG TPA: acetyl-CoA C-acetyltransferase [Acidimicrobiales bacterium]|nr:acetyl-CoA C-acetyltransferase [Acidimicrobiales bacterium]